MWLVLFSSHLDEVLLGYTTEVNFNMILDLYVFSGLLNVNDKLLVDGLRTAWISEYQMRNKKDMAEGAPMEALVALTAASKK